MFMPLVARDLQQLLGANSNAYAADEHEHKQGTGRFLCTALSLGLSELFAYSQTWQIGLLWTSEIGSRALAGGQPLFKPSRPSDWPEDAAS